MQPPLPRIFEGQEVVIAAGGPSLSGFDFDRLAGRNVIAINRAHEFIPGAQVLWWTDADYWRRAEASLMAHSAPYKATSHIAYRTAETPATAAVYRLTGPLGFDPDPRYLRHGNNSTYAAMHLAVHMGARRLILLGVDMRYGPAGESHFHGGHGVPHMESTLRETMLPMFASLAEPLAERGIEVLNANPNSAVTVWPRCTIEEALRDA